MQLAMFIHLTIVGCQIQTDGTGDVYSRDYIAGCQIQTDGTGDVYSLDHSGMSNSN